MPRLRLITVVLVTSMVCACGNNGTGSATPKPSLAASPAGGSALSTPLSSPLATLNVFTQSPSNPHIRGIECPQWLVLTGSGRSYTSAEMSQMTDYMIQTYGPRATAQGTLPPTIAKAAVALADPYVEGTRPRYWNQPSCSFTMQITNTGRDTVQISKIGLELTAPSKQNTEQYHLVEACKLAGTAAYCGVQLGGGPPQCSFYTVKVRLTGGNKGVDYLGSPVSKQPDGSQCPEITLASGSTVEAEVTVDSTEALVYPVQPVFVVQGSAGVMNVSVTSAAGFMTFAAPTQFDCSEVQGQSLTVQWSGPEALDWSALANRGLFCA
jgi:hypothetical protein